MRKRYDEEGNLIRLHKMVFDEIPDDYAIKPIMTDELWDISYMGVMEHLRDKKISEEFEDNKYYSTEVISHLALDYLYSAVALSNEIEKDRGNEVVSHYLIPAVFLCKHSVELKLKECLIEKGRSEIRGHNVIGLWEKLNETDVPSYDAISSFLKEMEAVDRGETALRYGVNKDLTPIKHAKKYNINIMLSNTKFFFNIVDEYIISKYRYSAAK